VPLPRMPNSRSSQYSRSLHSGEQATDAHCSATGLASQWDGHRYPRPKGEINIPTREHQEIIERWFEDLFTRADLSAVDELVSADFVAYGTGGDGQSIETRAPMHSGSGLVGTFPPSPTGSGPSTR
jgi:hypothetical protein